MGSLNKALLIGNVGRDAELRYTPHGAAVTGFSLATTENWNDKSGARQERTTWHQVELWGKPAETLTEYLRKGKQVYVEGRIQTDEYTDKEGIKRKATRIRADRVVLLGSAGPHDVRDDDVGHGEPTVRTTTPAATLTDDSIPF